MKAQIILVGLKKNIEMAIVELKSNIDYDNLEVKIIEKVFKPNNKIDVHAIAQDIHDILISNRKGEALDGDEVDDFVKQFSNELKIELNNINGNW